MNRGQQGSTQVRVYLKLRYADGHRRVLGRGQKGSMQVLQCVLGASRLRRRLAKQRCWVGVSTQVCRVSLLRRTCLNELSLLQHLHLLAARLMQHKPSNGPERRNGVGWGGGVGWVRVGCGIALSCKVQARDKKKPLHNRVSSLAMAGVVVSCHPSVTGTRPPNDKCWQ